MGDPCECKGLGSRLRGIETQEFLKNVVTFVILDWVLAGEYYTLTVLVGVHGKGLNPEIQIEAWTGSEYEGIGTDVFVATNGDVTFRVVREPDGRFNGRAIFM